MLGQGVGISVNRCAKAHSSCCLDPREESSDGKGCTLQAQIFLIEGLLRSGATQKYGSGYSGF